jgi:PAS domain S-box-containing protein
LKQTFTFLADEDSELRAQFKRLSLLLFLNASLYPLWTRLQYMVDSNAIDSYWERAAVYGLVLVLILIARFSNISPRNKINLLITNRWLFLGHYFSLAIRNHLSIPYAFPIFFLTFYFASAFERPRNFVPFALYAMALALIGTSVNPQLPTFYFRVAIATSLLLSFNVMIHRYHLTRALRANEKMLRDIFVTAGIGMALVDLDGEILTVNQALANMFGFTAKQLMGKHFDDFSPDKSLHPFQGEITKLINNEIPAVKMELSFLDAFGNIIWGNTSATMISGSSSFILALVEDISAHKAAELLVQDRQNKMHHSARMAALGEMAGGIAHEINNPLTIIDMTASVLRNKILKGEYEASFASDSLEKVQKMIDRIAKIIRGLRSFSRDGSHDPSLTYSARSILQGTLDLCEEKLKSNNVELRISESSPDCIVRCRGVEVSQVLLNVINNAFDAVVDLPKKWIEVNMVKEEKFIRIDILNNGPLIPEELKHKIYQPFFTTKPVGQGVGLGLSISLGIMASQGGALSHDLSRQYTCFSVRIPRES